jgi:putative peptide zinc metalloprotease protein
MTSELDENRKAEWQHEWRRVPGLQLLGPVADSGLVKPTYLVQRPDGQVVQLSELLNVVLATAGTGKPPEELARRVSDTFGKELSVEGLKHLIDTKLAPLGLIEDASAASPTLVHPPKADPLLALRLRGTILPARAVNALAAWLSPLFFPPVVIFALVAFVAVDIVLLTTGDVFGALRDMLISPAMLLGFFVLMSFGGLIHELGHAAACRYGGAKPGVIGYGLYLVFPAFFTNVTDSYRLGRTGRLRTDLGGLYFNVWTVLVTGTAYLLTGEGIFLLLVLTTQLQMVQQLPPIVRLDGYFVLADLAGVPDLFSRVRPLMRSLLPGRPADPRVVELKPGARRIVSAWVLTVIPLLVFTLGWLVWSLPWILTATFEAVTVHSGTVASAAADGDLALLLVAVLSIVLLVIPILGLAVVLWRLSRSLISFLRTSIGKHLRHPSSATAASH